MTQPAPLTVLFEHPTWQRPFFDALEARGVPYQAFDLKQATVDALAEPPSELIFSQASPSAYVRGNGQAVAMARTVMEHWEAAGARVLNGAAAFRLELNKLAQVQLLHRLGLAAPKTVAFNHLDAIPTDFPFPAILKPNQGGSGARMAVVESPDELRTLLAADPTYWTPDPVLLLQEKLEPSPTQDGIVRMEFVGGEFLYAMRVRNTDGFNLCPSEDCNPADGGDGLCEIPAGPPPEFLPFLDVPTEAIEQATRLFRATGFDVGGLEYMETVDGRRVFYDMNANSNLRRPVGEAFGFDPFDRVAAWLEGVIGG